MKYVAYIQIDLGSITTEEMAKLPDQFADPNKPANYELESYFSDRQQNLAESNTGSEKIANELILWSTEK